jgi:hypothetical protein
MPKRVSGDKKAAPALASFHLKHKLNFPAKMKLASSLFPRSVVVFIYNLKSCKVAALWCVIIFGSRTPSKQTAAKEDLCLEKGRICGELFFRVVCVVFRVVSGFILPARSLL